MHVRWFGQSAFLLSDGERRLMVDPFGDGKALAASGRRFDYHPIDGIHADLLLITHEHFDHNAAEVAGGDPVVLRSTAGRLESPVGEVVAIASEHDDQAGTARVGAEGGAPRAPGRVSLRQLLPFGAGTIRMYGLGSSQPSG